MKSIFSRQISALVRTVDFSRRIILLSIFSDFSFGLSFETLEANNLQLAFHVLLFTFYQASLSTLLTLLIGLPSAYLFARFDFHGKSLLRALTTVPFMLPTVVVAAGFNALLGLRGWINLTFMHLLSLSSPPI